MKSCLIVDDSKVVRMVARKIIEGLNFAIEEADNGQTAMDQCLKRMPDAILLDWNMPVMSGIDFLRNLRQMPGGQTPVVVFCSTENDIQHIQEAISAGANEYIMKPFDSEIIESKFTRKSDSFNVNKKKASVPGMRPETKPAVAAGGGPYRVMVVDDSAVIRGLLTKTLETDPEIKVTSTVGNGQAAIDALKRTDIDVIVLDIEMPVMDGLTALPKLLEARAGVQIIMASTLTLKGASVSMKALSLGAADYLSKPTTTTGISTAADFKRDLVEKVKSLGPGLRAASAACRRAPPRHRARTLRRRRRSSIPARSRCGLPPSFPARVDCLAIGSSTGGPQALFAVFRALGRIDRMPVFVTQHMPATFTTILAEHLAQASGMPAAEAKDGEPALPGRIYVAPGDFHMVVESQGGSLVVSAQQESA